MMSILTIFIQHSFGRSSHGNQRRKRNKKKPNWKIISKTITVCRWYDFIHVCVLSHFSSVTQSCPTLCNPMNRSMPGLPVHHQLPEPTQTHVHWVGDTIQPSHPVNPSSSCLQSFPASGSFQMSQLFASGGQSSGVSASTSVLRMNTQDWCPLGWTGWISLQSKGFSRVFSNTTVQKHQFFGT